MSSDSGAPLRVAIAGTGMIGAVHLRAARDSGADVVGVLGSSAERSRQTATKWRVGRPYAALDEVLADDIDVLHVCTPNDSHLEYAEAALRAGIAVICEKPLATTPADAQQLADLAAETGVVATVPFAYRFHPLVREIRARRLADEFGRVNLVHGSYLQDWLVNPNSSSWRVDSAIGGASRAFGDIGSHWCDLAEFISGERFISVTATTSTVYADRPRPGKESFSGQSDSTERLPVDTEDIAVATFRCASGAVANTVISQVAAGRKNRLWVEVDGSGGSAAFNQEEPNVIWLGRETESILLHRGESTARDDQARLNRVPSGHPQGYPDAFAAFAADTYAAVRGAAPEGLPTFADGLRAVTITDAVLRAAASGSSVSIDNPPRSS